MDAIEHTASPFHLNAVDPDELIKPGINGTVGILKSILKDESTKVKRVVITSSGAAVFRHNPNPTTFTEADWNNQYGLEILEKYEDEGRKNEGPNMEKYRASKTLAERSAWDFVNSPENKPRINYSQVFGANHTLKSPRQLLNTSAALFYNYVAYGAKAAGNDFLANTGVCWTNVRDVAEAHALALEKETAGGERIIVSAGL
ncbi:hypothetical protein OG21DRAFT_1510555 [Imleria badia]|nr:hypothetical protein OG21DRAFT_1510555 [Imleria badia]